MRMYFKQSQRLRRQRDFTAALAYKCFVRKGVMRLYAAPNKQARTRFGVSVSRQCGKAVDRNRLKRLAREVFRRHQHDLPPGRDYLLILSAHKPINKDRNSALLFYYSVFESHFLGMVENLSKKDCFKCDTAQQYGQADIERQ